MKMSVEIVPKQAVFDEFAGRPVADRPMIPVVPSFIHEDLRKTITIIQRRHYISKQSLSLFGVKKLIFSKLQLRYQCLCIRFFSTTVSLYLC